MVPARAHDLCALRITPLCLCLQAFAYLIPEELFKMELEEGVERVQMTIGVLRSFKRLFHTHRQRIPQYYRSGETVKQWDFPSTLVFHRADQVLDRLLMIEVCVWHGFACVSGHR